MEEKESNAMESRRSIRKYTDQKVSDDQIETIVKAASLAPSAKNRQPWKYLVYEGEAKEELLLAMERGLEKEKKEHSLLPGSAFALIGANDWKAGQLRQQCEEAGWIFLCSSTYWQIFYTTDDAVKRVGDMREEIQFQIQENCLQIL